MSSKKRLLLVDDEADLIEILSTVLDSLNDKYIIDTASNGTEALGKIQSEVYELVLTDYMMPKMDGITLTQHIHKISPDTQVIMMTSHSSDEFQETLKNIDLDGYITKPFQVGHIYSIVEDALKYTQEGADAYRTGERVAPPSVTVLLQNLRIDTGARCILLLSDGGYPIEMAGDADGLDVSSISALVAANFLATAELARLLGDTSVFKASYQEGPDYNIYAYRVNESALITIIFGAESKSGIVRYYARKTADKIDPLLDALNDMPDEFVMEGDVDSAIDHEFDQLWE